MTLANDDDIAAMEDESIPPLSSIPISLASLNLHFIDSFSSDLNSSIINCKSDNQYSYIQDLHDLLVRKRLRSFNNFYELEFLIVVKTDDYIFYDMTTSVYKGEYSGFLLELQGVEK